MISNPQAQAIPSTLSVDEFARAMAATDWQAIPPENRARAMAARITALMLLTTSDPLLASRTPTIRPR